MTHQQFNIGASEATPEALNHFHPDVQKKKKKAEFAAAPAAAPNGKLAALYAALIAKGTDPKRAWKLAHSAQETKFTETCDGRVVFDSVSSSKQTRDTAGEFAGGEGGGEGYSDAGASQLVEAAKTASAGDRAWADGKAGELLAGTGVEKQKQAIASGIGAQALPVAGPSAGRANLGSALTGSLIGHQASSLVKRVGAFTEDGDFYEDE